MGRIDFDDAFCKELNVMEIQTEVSEDKFTTTTLKAHPHKIQLNNSPPSANIGKVKAIFGETGHNSHIYFKGKEIRNIYSLLITQSFGRGYDANTVILTIHGISIVYGVKKKLAKMSRVGIRFPTHQEMVALIGR